MSSRSVVLDVFNIQNVLQAFQTPPEKHWKFSESAIINKLYLHNHNYLIKADIRKAENFILTCFDHCTIVNEQYQKIMQNFVCQQNTSLAQIYFKLVFFE